VLEQWLGAWDRRKAAFLIDLASTANVISPIKTWPILSIGREYVTKHRGSAHGAADDDFERTWHHAALGLLQEHSLATYEDKYLDGLRPPSATGVDRLALAHGIAQEQRCWNDRPDLSRAGDAADTVTRAAGGKVTGDGASASMVTSARERQELCWQDALTRFAVAFSSPGTNAEAHVRSAWVLFQQERPKDALAMLDGVTTGDDRELAYWAGLFGGRINDALGRHAEAERAYRAALAASPGAQSAGIGLALTLFKMDRDHDADAVALAVRTRSGSVADPWWTYPMADRRFVDGWIDALRRQR
jgi:tetratricopeptide (TPR) repeat protein